MDAFRWQTSKLQVTAETIIHTGQVRTGKYNKCGRSHASDRPNSNASAVRERQGRIVLADAVECPGRWRFVVVLA
jgi:hypothetical protein